MAQIFVSHSKKDQNIKDFFSSMFGSLNVKHTYMEFEADRTDAASNQIMQQIQASNALFVLLKSSFQTLKILQRINCPLPTVLV